MHSYPIYGPAFAMAKQETVSLRDLQKIERRERIIDATVKLLTSVGFDDVTLEDIAREARISIPTLYSYFNSKSDIIFSLFEADEKMIEARVRDVLKKLPADPVRAIVEIELAAMKGGVDITQKRLWREVSAAALQAPAERRMEYRDLQELRVSWIAEALDQLKHNGSVPEDVDSRAAGMLFYAIARECFRRYVMDEGESIEDLEKNLFLLVSAGYYGIENSLTPY